MRHPGTGRASGVIRRIIERADCCHAAGKRLWVVHIAALPGRITRGGLRHDHALPPRAVPGGNPCADAALAPGPLDMDPYERMTGRHPALTPARACPAGDSICSASHRPYRTSVRYPRLGGTSMMRHAGGKRAAMSAQPSLALT